MIHIETTASLESLSYQVHVPFIPDNYIKNQDIFPEREIGIRDIYIEAGDQVPINKLKKITLC